MSKKLAGYRFENNVVELQNDYD